MRRSFGMGTRRKGLLKLYIGKNLPRGATLYSPVLMNHDRVI